MSFIASPYVQSPYIDNSNNAGLSSGHIGHSGDTGCSGYIVPINNSISLGDQIKHLIVGISFLGFIIYLVK
jgi:hypothetical protein